MALESLLTECEAGLLAGEVQDSLERLTLGLAGFRSNENGSFVSLIRQCRAHSVFHRLHEDPFTWHAYHKPRGYPGDAQLMDMIYGLHEPASEPSVLGGQISEHRWACAASEAVRQRRCFAAKAIDTVCSSKENARILSVACGHLRELELSTQIRQGQFGDFVGYDQDGESLEECKRCYGEMGVSTSCGESKDLKTNLEEGEPFDFIYSLGLFDYLPEEIAQELVGQMYSLLLPGGRLLIANLQKGTVEAGYMEAIMDWKLIYRDAGDMRRIGEGFPNRVFRPISDVVFLEITKEDRDTPRDSIL